MSDCSVMVPKRSFVCAAEVTPSEAELGICLRDLW